MKACKIIVLLAEHVPTCVADLGCHVREHRPADADLWCGHAHLRHAVEAHHAVHRHAWHLDEVHLLLLPHLLVADLHRRLLCLRLCLCLGLGLLGHVLLLHLKLLHLLHLCSVNMVLQLALWHGQVDGLHVSSRWG